MCRPILVVMAAGMGSRYGGLKQLDSVGPSGEVIMDYSIYDAKRAGFERVIFIIKHSIEKAFREKIGNAIEPHMQVSYAFQDVDDLPEGYQAPEGREKPWGTAHAILAARDLIDAPFAVINADDYYGPECFEKIYQFLTSHSDDGRMHFCMAGFLLKNTVTENGSVARGICKTDAANTLLSVTEYTRIEQQPDAIRYTEDDGATWHEIDGETPVSMNLWGFSKGFIAKAWEGFPAFLDSALTDNPQKAEYFLPGVVSDLIAKKEADVTVLTTGDKWYGVTYREDKPSVVTALAEKTAAGLYPSPVWRK